MTIPSLPSTVIWHHVRLHHSATITVWPSKHHHICKVLLRLLLRVHEAFGKAIKSAPPRARQGACGLTHPSKLHMSCVLAGPRNSCCSGKWQGPWLKSKEWSVAGITRSMPAADSYISTPIALQMRYVRTGACVDVKARSQRTTMRLVSSSQRPRN